MRVAWAIAGAVGALIGSFGGCGRHEKNGGPPDAATDATVTGPVDSGLPETVVIILEEAGAPKASSRVMLMSGLPTPCEDTSKHLGTVTFAQADEDVIITSSKTKARATCTRQDEHTLLCDWVGMDGKPSVRQKPVTYGPKKPIGGAFDKSHSFRCRAQL
jgi:hypothetical protein